MKKLMLIFILGVFFSGCTRTTYVHHTEPRPIYRTIEYRDAPPPRPVYRVIEHRKAPPPRIERYDNRNEPRRENKRLFK